MIYAEGSDTQIGVAFGVGFGVAFGVTTPNRGCVWFCGPDQGQMNAFKPRDQVWEPEIGDLSRSQPESPQTHNQMNATTK